MSAQTRTVATFPQSSAISRREMVQQGMLAFAGLTLPNVLGFRAAAASSGQSQRQTAVIFVQLGGGPSHFETYDPKPEAPAEYRGALKAIQTSVPGVSFCELLPRQAALMNELAIVRSVYHQEASHIALHMVETGYFLRDSRKARKGEMPSVGSIVSRVRQQGEAELPAFASLPGPQAYSSAAHLGGQHSAFAVDADPSLPGFRVPNLSLLPSMDQTRLFDRQSLLHSFDDARRVLDLEGSAEAIDSYQRQALELLTGQRARTAFNLEREPVAVRDQYGRNPLGQRLLLARRLVEAGVPFVAVRTFDWDDHDALAAKMTKRAPMYDMGLAALIGDLRDRGMKQDVLVVAMGEFGRTPRVNKNGGRDHWPAVMSVLLAGGSLRTGQAIGASDSKGARVASAPYRPQSILATVYRHLGIDPALTFDDFTGRPRYILEEREPIRELL